MQGGWVSAFDKSAGTLVDAGRHGRTHPARLTAHAPGEAPQRIEGFNDELLAGLNVGKVEEVWIEGAQGPGADVGRLPARLRCQEEAPGAAQHPRRPAHRRRATTGTTAGTTNVFAAQGYVVASVNYHGSSSFGYAFLDSITHRWGELELQDVEAGTDWLLKKPWVATRTASSPPAAATAATWWRG